MTFELWRPGMRITADRLNASTSSTYQTWTPTWSTTSGNTGQNYGNGTVIGNYVVSGLTCYWDLHVQFGSTTNFGGSENWTFSLPVSAAMSDGPMGFVNFYVGDENSMPGIVRIQTVDTMCLYIGGASYNKVRTTEEGVMDSGTGTDPERAWQANDTFEALGHYRIAA